VVIEESAPGVTGKIQVGAVPGDSAQVIVPACGVPLAGGTEPNAPVGVFTDPLEGAVPQAARPMAAATAPTASSVIGRKTARRAALRAAPVPCNGVGALSVSRRVIRPPPILTISRNDAAAQRMAWLRACRANWLRLKNPCDGAWSLVAEQRAQPLCAGRDRGHHVPHDRRWAVTLEVVTPESPRLPEELASVGALLDDPAFFTPPAA
jgi:hypothetical protein